MPLLFRYTFKKISFVTCMLSLILIGVVWLTQSLRFIEIIVNHNISLKEYFLLVICLIPDLLATILPICLLIAGLHVYHKLKTHHELHIFRAVGLSPSQIASPLLVLGLLLTLCVYGINIYVTPVSFKQFRNQEYQLRNQFSLSWVREGTFNLIKGITTYVREQGKDGELKGVFIYNPQTKENSPSSKKSNPYTIIAESGRIEKNAHGLFLILKRGSRQEIDPLTHKVSEFSFDILKYSLPSHTNNSTMRTTKPYEKSLTELLNPPPDTDLNLARKMRIEAHQRLLLPWLSLINSLLGSVFMLLGSFRRREGRYKIFIAAFLSLIIHINLILLLNLSSYYPYALTLAYVLVTILIFGLGVILNFSQVWGRLKTSLPPINFKRKI